MDARFDYSGEHISPALILDEERVLPTKEYPISFNNLISKHQAIPAGTSQNEFDNGFQCKLPDLVIFAIVSDADMSAGYQAYPFHIHHFVTNFICLKANLEQIFTVAYQPNFPNCDDIRRYLGVI